MKLVIVLALSMSAWAADGITIVPGVQPTAGSATSVTVQSGPFILTVRGDAAPTASKNILFTLAAPWSTWNWSDPVNTYIISPTNPIPTAGLTAVNWSRLGYTVTILIGPCANSLCPFTVSGSNPSGPFPQQTGTF